MSLRYHFKGIETAGILWILYDKSYRDDRKLTWEDADEFVIAGGALTLVWADVAFAGVATWPLVVIEAAVVGGLVASIAIGGVEGGEAYIDFITSDPEEMWEKTVEVTLPAIKEKVVSVGKEIQEKSEEIQIAAVAWVDRRLMEGQRYIEQEYQEKKQLVETGWDLLTTYPVWGNPFGPSIW